ncbi:hypothetical protein [Streptomyces sp. SBT349]|uniref:hypothetical protein n=1 Tax=Streptomyces sp. SBT349 TaxID=1580539 RepID=UPI000A637BD2|nr:hypothetical protein [Streptomyces sp. SBT349]
MTASASIAEWIPGEGEGVRGVECGRWFDAVHLPTFAGVRLHRRLGDRSGPVIRDSDTDSVHWLIPPGSGSGWNTAAQVLRRGFTVSVPPASWTALWAGPPTAGWVVPPSGNCLTAPEVLHDALRLEFAGAPGVRRV